MPVDMTMNALSITLMYKFSRKLYLCACSVCIGCCKVCIKTVDKNIFIDMPSVYELKTRSSVKSQSSATKTPSVIVPTTPIDSNVSGSYPFQ